MTNIVCKCLFLTCKCRFISSHTFLRWFDDFCKIYGYHRNKHYFAHRWHVTLPRSFRQSCHNFVSLFCVALACLYIVALMHKLYDILGHPWIGSFLILNFSFMRIYYICQYVQISTISWYIIILIFIIIIICESLRMQHAIRSPEKRYIEISRVTNLNQQNP